MAGWFDTHAKKSATTTKMDLVASGGVSRRRVMIGGSATVAATAAAWTAPTLMASAAAATGLSVCPADRIKQCTDGSSTCCPNATDTCTIVGGQQVCSAVTQPGGTCSNCGNGQCAGAYKCSGNEIQDNNAERTNICGGEGAQCCPGKPAVAGCFGDNLTCVQQEAGAGFCRKSCTDAGDCRTDGVTPGNPRCTGSNPGPQVCSAGYCAKTCTRDADCNAGAACNSAGVCNYPKDGQLTTICAAA